MMDEFSRLLKEQGLRCTPGRKAILEVLGEAGRPLDAQEIFLSLQKGTGKQSLSTVYRALEVLEARGLVRQSYQGEQGEAYYEPALGSHRHYLHCRSCGAVLPLEGCPLGDYEAALERRTGYRITGHRLDLYGDCPQCQRKEAGHF